MSPQVVAKALFRMAPFHRHFELASWAEVTVIIRFRLLAAICRALGLDIFYSERLAATYAEGVNILAVL